MKKLVAVVTLVGAGIIGNIQAMVPAKAAGKKVETRGFSAAKMRLLAEDYFLHVLMTGENEHPNASGFPRKLSQLLASRTSGATSGTVTPESELSEDRS